MISEERKTIIEVAENSFLMSIVGSLRYKPGECFQRLPENQKEILKGLKSEHMDGILPFWLRPKQ